MSKRFWNSSLHLHFAAAWNNKGNALNELGRNKEGLDCCHRALELDPYDVGPWINKGRALNELDWNEEALFCYDRALALNQHNNIAWNHKRVALMALGRYQEALACFEKAQQLGNPKAAIAIKVCQLRQMLGLG